MTFRYIFLKQIQVESTNDQDLSDNVHVLD